MIVHFKSLTQTKEEKNISGCKGFTRDIFTLMFMLDNCINTRSYTNTLVRITLESSSFSIRVYFTRNKMECGRKFDELLRTFIHLFSSQKQLCCKSMCVIHRRVCTLNFSCYCIGFVDVYRFIFYECFIKKIKKKNYIKKQEVIFFLLFFKSEYKENKRLLQIFQVHTTSIRTM
jgi:hypothetical protein